MWPDGIEARERSLAKTQSFWPMRKMKAKFRNDAGRDRTEGASTIKTLSFYSETLATCRKTQTAALGAETTVFLAKTAMNSSIHTNFFQKLLMSTSFEPLCNEEHESIIKSY